MPLVPFRPMGLSPLEREFSQADILARTAGTTQAPASDEVPRPELPDSARDPFLDSDVGLAFRNYGVVGSALLDWLPYQLRRAQISGEEDHAWDVTKYATDEFLNANPFMLEHFQSGVADSFPNEQRFLNFVSRQRDDWQIREYLGSKGTIRQIATTLPGQIVDAVTGGLALRALQGPEKAVALANWVRTGTTGQRAIKGALLGAGLNLTQEEMLRGLNPDRNVNEIESGLMAVGTGALFGSGVPLLMGGKNALGQAVSEASIRRNVQGVAEAIASPLNATVEQTARADAEALRAIRDTPNTSAFDAARARLAGLEPGKKLSRTEVDAILQGTGFRAQNQGWPTVDDMAGYLDEMAAGRGRPVPPEAPPVSLSETEAPPVATSETKGSPLPKIKINAQDYVVEAIDRGREAADKAGASKIIDELSAQRLTAMQVAQELENRGLFPGMSVRDIKNDIVQPARASLGIPSMDMKTEFEAWLAARSSPSSLAPTPAAPTGQEFKFTFTPGQGVKPAVGAAEAGVSIGPAGEARQAAEPTQGGWKRSVTVIKNAETKKLMDEIRAKHGLDAVEFLDHPMQDQYDWLQSLKDMQKELTAALPEDQGVVRNTILKVIGRGIPMRTLETPASALATAESSLARRAGRLFFDFTRQTAETAADPLHAVNRTPAEALLWNYDLHRDVAQMTIDKVFKDGLKGGPISHTFADGSIESVKGYMSGRHTFGRMVTDELRERAAIARGAPASPTQQVTHPAVASAADAATKYFQQMAKEGGVASLFKSPEEFAYHYISRRYLRDEVANNQRDFESLLIKNYERNRLVEYHGGRPIDPHARPLVQEAFDLMTPEDKAKIRDTYINTGPDQPKVKKDTIPDLTEADLIATLGKDGHDRYLAQIDEWHRSKAAGVFKAITKMDNADGVEHGMTGSALLDRTQQIDEREFGQYLDDDAYNLLYSYHHQVAGKVASRMAIKNSEDLWGPLVKELTKKDLAAEGYNPDLIIEAVRADFQRYLRATVDNPKAQASINDSLSRTLDERTGVLTAKLRELQGGAVFPGNAAAAAGWRLAAERILLRLPYMAALGKMTVSMFNDVATGVFHKALTPRHIGTMVSSLNLLKNMDRRGLEAVMVATSDMARGLRAAEYGDLPAKIDSGRFGAGRTGRILAAADAATEYLTQKFASATLSNRWNSNLKRGLAHMIMQNVMEDARKMAKAGSLKASGMSMEEAIARAGLSPEEAKNMGRFGLNSKTSAQLVEQLNKHATDMDGNPLKAGHDGYVHPQVEKWSEAAPEARDAFLHAVNSQVLDSIVEPKRLSRPLSTATFWGRVFHQFQSFAYAWGNQTLPLAMQRSGYQQAAYVGLSLAIAAIADATHNQLSGRRTFGESIDRWQTNPVPMLYSAINRAGIFGWLGRPMGVLDNAGVGIGPMVGSDFTTTVYGRPITRKDLAAESFGPLVGYMNNLGNAVLNVGGDRGRIAFRAIPFRNLWAVDAFNRLAEYAGYKTPIGPVPVKPGQ